MAQPDSKQADDRQTGQRTKRTGRQPISRHPLFPAIVALWFATLIGIGSLVLSTALIENLVLASRVDSLIPAAAPPLGATARLLLALALGLPGGAIGWVLAKRLSAAKPHAGPQVFNFADTDLHAQPQWPGVAEAPQAAEVRAPVEAGMRAEPETHAGKAAAGPAPLLDPSRLAQDVVEAAPPPTADIPAAEAIVEQAVLSAPPALTAAQRILTAELAELSHVELVERLAIALQRREELLGAGAGATTETANPVLQFPDFADRRTARLALSAAQSRPVPQETEKALREALANLGRISGAA